MTWNLKVLKRKLEVLKKLLLLTINKKLFWFWWGCKLQPNNLFYQEMLESFPKEVMSLSLFYWKGQKWINLFRITQEMSGQGQTIGNVIIGLNKYYFVCSMGCAFYGFWWGHFPRNYVPRNIVNMYSNVTCESLLPVIFFFLNFFQVRVSKIIMILWKCLHYTCLRILGIGTILFGIILCRWSSWHQWFAFTSEAN